MLCVAYHEIAHDMARELMFMGSVSAAVPALPIENQWGTASWRAAKADRDNVTFSLDHGFEMLCKRKAGAM